MKYHRIIIGAGAAGLYYAANCPAGTGLILEQSPSPGKKLLLSGSGQCNLTHGGSIKDFIDHYGQKGRKIRSALYKANNLLLMRFFQEQGLALTQRPDGKVFPASMKASHVLELLMRLSRENGWSLKTGCPASSIAAEPDGGFLVNERYRAEQVIIACGGCSVPSTGSDGSIFSILEGMGIEIVPPRPALVPVTVQQYPYGPLSGISFQDALVQIDGHRQRGDLLLTHTAFSGPAVLNLSRYARPGSTLTINYLPDFPTEASGIRAEGEKRRCASFLAEALGLPKRFGELTLNRAGIGPDRKAASLSRKEQTALFRLLTCDTFSVSGTSGFGSAMATCGGVSLEEVDLKTFESKKYPGLFIIGETLDVDGDTGGYNLQFAFSSAYLAAKCR